MNKETFYTRLAKYYDRIYHYIDYDKQVDFFVNVIRKFNKSGSNKILDVACGTGTHADFLQKRGFEVTGFDISNEMLEEAKKKNSNVKFVLGDMKKLKMKEKSGTIICFFTSILYNKNRDEMKKTLSGFYSHLEKGGLVIFDVVDKSIGINHKTEEYKYERGDLKIIFIPQWIYNKKENVMDLEIDFFINGEKLHDHHVMGAFSIDELKKMLKETGFEVFVLEKNFNSAKKHRSEKKAIFVCRKPYM